MAMNSTKSNNFSATLFPLSASNAAVSKSEALAVKGMSQLVLNHRIESLRKISLATKNRAVMFHGNAAEKVKGKEVLRGLFWGVSGTSLGDGGDTERILRASEIVRVKLENAVCNAITEQSNKKAKEMVQAKLLSASPFASETDAVGGTSSTQLAIIAPLQRGSFLNHFAYPFPNNCKSSHFSQAESEVDKSMTLCATPLSVCFPHESNYGREKTRNSNVGGEAIEDVCCREDDEREYDGRMHSNPYKKNGPYTCPKCGGVFETSQRFAAHVSWRHYKYETKSERKKRMMAKIRRRSLRLEWENGALTVVADHDAPRVTAFGFVGNNTNVAPPPATATATATAPVEVKIETETGVGLQLAPPPGWPKRTGGRPESAGGCRIKMKALDN